MLLKELLPSVCSEFGELNITGITSNSACVEKGSMFFCISGTKFDGHNFATDAAQKGAAVIIAEKDTGVKNQIIVNDTRAFYAKASAKWWGEPAKKLKLIGITGTNGKTSVSYMIKYILESVGYKVGLIGTIQNMIGNTVYTTKHTTPDAYELNGIFAKMCEEGCDYAIMEVSSHALDQKRVYDACFEVGIFTNLTQDHLDYHITMENYASAKALLFNMCKIAVINADDTYSSYMKGISKKDIFFSFNNTNCNYYTENVKFRPDSVSYTLNGEEKLDIKLATGGRFSVYNSMCAAITAKELGVDSKQIGKALAQMNGVKGRAESVENNLGVSIIIDYAHTPDGLKSILNTFAECEKNKLTVLFGCGGDRDKTKRAIMGRVAEEIADNLIVTSDNPRTEDPMAIINDILEGIENKDKVTVIENRIEAIKHAVKTASKNDILVLAGKGHETYQILKDKTIELDERKVVLEALKERTGE